jgi:hypothetical protein
LRAPLTGLALEATSAGQSRLTTLALRSRRAALRLVSRVLSSIETNLQLPKLFFEPGTALDVIDPMFKIINLFILFGQKFGENVVQKLSLCFPFGDDVLLDDGGEPVVSWDRLACGLARPLPIRVHADRITIDTSSKYRAQIAGRQIPDVVVQFLLGHN